MYHFGVPGVVIWITHILLGFYFMFLGYKLIDKLRKHGLILISLGVLMAAYHSHLLFFKSHDK
jgi:hypothetical protein